MVINFRRKYFVAFLILLLIETCIAVLIPDGFIRQYFGDFLVVILIYCLLMSLFKLKPLAAAWMVLILATAIEIGQYFKVLDILGLGDNPLAILVLGNTFSLADLIAYFLGITTVVVIENLSRDPS